MSSSPFTRIIGPASEPVPKPKAWVLPPRGLTVFHGETNLPRLSHYFLPQLLTAGNSILYLDGANRFDPLLLARFARGRGLEPSVFNRKLRVARAFTCFQLTELLNRLPKLLKQFPAHAVFITALPDLYFDEDVREPEARASFQQALHALGRMTNQRIALAVFTDAPGFPTPRQRFFHQLIERSDQVRRFVDDAGGGPYFVAEKDRPQLKK